MRYGPYFAIFIVAAVAAYAAAIGFGSISFEEGLAERVVTHLLALTFFALLIERAVEVIVNNKFIKRELSVDAEVVKLRRKCAILQSALDMELQQPVPAMTDQAALAAANAAKNDTIERLREQITAAKKDKIAADQQAMPLREELGTEKAAFAASTATVLGGLVALTGTTVLAEFVDVTTISAANKFLGLFDQLQLFVAVDVLFTALILAGGSDGIHQIVKGVLSAKDDMALT
ncbi:hypothetical protein [Roseobacter sinensis]|uniref:MotA/TolQ/ExbB proton channel domain-containing protein n=1 Tax=Roseobacter sinensis TaxID=2931391 RepID=A0ABT3BHG7_9RHOB|nr:hypothetical protein [Roseobacter sp. WL0113]MCV3272633.1 hypothetical protein [Roseobacter sp. WL0113]